MTFITISENISVLYDEYSMDVRVVFLHSCGGKDNYNPLLTLLHNERPMKRAVAADLMGKIKTDVKDLVNTGLWEEPEGPEKSGASESFTAEEINRMKKTFVWHGHITGKWWIGLGW